MTGKLPTIIAVTLGLLGPTLPAAQRTWDRPNTSIGDWITPANWSADTRPTLGDTAIINNSGTAQLSGIQVGNYTDFRLGDSIPGSAGTVNISGGALYGTNAYLGSVTGGRGTVNVGTGTFQNAYLYVGYSGTGALNLNGGYVTGSNTIIAAQAGSHGSVSIASGTWNNTSTLSIGSSGTASFNLSGGRFNTMRIFSSENLNSHATVTISGGTMSVSDYFHVGFQSTATLNLSDALLDVGTSLMAANTVDGRAAITISGSGVLSARTVGKGFGAATLALDGGTLRANSDNADFMYGYQTGDITLLAGGGHIDTGTNTITVATGFTGTGALHKEGTGRMNMTGSSAHSGGTVITSGTLAIGNAAALGTGTLNIRDGQLFVQESIRPQNDITLSGGTLAQEYIFGENLAGAIDATSDLAGGRDTHAIILESVTINYAILESSFSATSGATNDELRVSDLLHLSGLQLVNGTDTAAFILQLTLDTPTPGAFLARLDDNNEWTNPGLPDPDDLGQWTGHGYAGTFEQFRLEFTEDLYNYVGIWGFTDTTVWALLNQNGDYAVASAVPEPSTWALFGFGALALGYATRRRRKMS